MSKVMYKSNASYVSCLADVYYYTRRAPNDVRQHHTEILTDISNGNITDLASFYDATSAMLKPKPRGKMLKDKKKRTSQREFQRDAKGSLPVISI